MSEPKFPSAEELKKQQAEIASKATQEEETKKKVVIDGADVLETTFQSGQQLDAIRAQAQRNVEFFKDLEKKGSLAASGPEVLAETRQTVKAAGEAIGEIKEKAKNLMSNPEINAEVERRAKIEDQQFDEKKAKEAKKEEINEAMQVWVTENLVRLLEQGAKLFQEVEETRAEFDAGRDVLMKCAENNISDKEILRKLTDASNQVYNPEKDLSSILEKGITDAGWLSFSLKSGLKSVLASTELQQFFQSKGKLRNALEKLTVGAPTKLGCVYSEINNDTVAIEALKGIKEKCQKEPHIVFSADDLKKEAAGIVAKKFDKELVNSAIEYAGDRVKGKA